MNRPTHDDVTVAASTTGLSETGAFRVRDPGALAAGESVRVAPADDVEVHVRGGRAGSGFLRARSGG
ncbi:MAG: hypothetical protein R6U70_08480, partial [Bacillota bacterium]